MEDKIVLDKDTVERIAYLARLSVSDSEKEALISDMNEIVDFASKLLTLDVDDETSLEYETNVKNVFREDICEKEISDSELLSALENVSSGYIVVPKVIE